MVAYQSNTLDLVLLRPGRLDRKIEFPLPDWQQKRLIFSTITGTMNLSDEVDLAVSCLSVCVLVCMWVYLSLYVIGHIAMYHVVKNLVVKVWWNCNLPNNFLSISYHSFIHCLWLHVYLCVHQCLSRRSGWSGFGRTTISQGKNKILFYKKQVINKY